MHCCSLVLLQPEEHADVAVVRFRGPLVQGVGLFGQNVSRNTEISFGTAIGFAPGQKPCARFLVGGFASRNQTNPLLKTRSEPTILC